MKYCMDGFQHLNNLKMFQKLFLFWRFQFCQRIYFQFYGVPITLMRKYIATWFQHYWFSRLGLSDHHVDDDQRGRRGVDSPCGDRDQGGVTQGDIMVYVSVFGGKRCAWSRTSQLSNRVSPSWGCGHRCRHSNGKWIILSKFSCHWLW